MKYFYIILTLLGLASCFSQEKNKSEQTVKGFQILLDSAKVGGTILIHDLNNNQYYSNDFVEANKGTLPASIFKIPNSIIALETGVVTNDSTLFKWNGEKRALKVWEEDLLFREAFQRSCVPCFQEIAKNVGLDRMRSYLNKLDYAQMQVDSANLEIFWLEGSSRVSAIQQVDFLKRLYTRKLPIQKRTEVLMKKIMLIEESPSYLLSGKTGLSISDEMYKGWFVGYIEKDGNTYFFATRLSSKSDMNYDKFLSLRKELSLEAFRQLDIL